MKEQAINILQADNHTIYGILWNASEKPKAVLQIVHGMTEHIDRYRKFAEELNRYGIAVAGFDLRGHGVNLSKSGCASFGEEGWEASLEDIQKFSDYLYDQFPDCQHYMLGFSLGSFLVREYLNKFDHHFSGAIIAGTGHQPPAVLSIMMAIVKTQIKSNGFDNTTPLVKQLSFETYNTKFKPNNTDFDWLCSDEAELQKYILDNSCADSISSGLFWQLLSSMKYTASGAAYKNWKKDMPILLISGDKDPVGDFGKGVRRVEASMKKAGITNIVPLLLPGARHDIFHEIQSGCFSYITENITNWILKIK